MVMPSLLTFGRGLPDVMGLWQKLGARGMTIHGVAEQLVLPPSDHPAHPFVVASLQRAYALEERILTFWSERMAIQARAALTPLVPAYTSRMGGCVTRHMGEILRLFNGGVSIPEIALHVGIGKNHIYATLARLRAAGVLWKLPSAAEIVAALNVGGRA